MSLSVLHVGYPLAPVGPDAVGGAEQILTTLHERLIEAGHRSFVIGGEYIGRAITPAVQEQVQKRHRDKLEALLRREPVDIVHMHGVDCAAYLPETDIPTLVTLHLPPEWYPAELFSLERRHLYFNCVSRSEDRRARGIRRLLAPVANGIPIDRFAGRDEKHEYAAALGRICPEKGFHHALNAARESGMPLLLAGETFGYPAHVEYFQAQIIPRLDSRRRFIGSVGFEAKRRLLGQARCTLVPSLAPETSCLVAMESLACGTPVIAFASGALPEIVEHGTNGFVVSDEREMTQSLARLAEIDPAACRDSALRRFSAQEMTGGYIAHYERILGHAH